MRLVDADALMVTKQWENCTCPAQVIHNAPTIDPETLRPTGRWVNGRILVGGFAEILGFDCSVCGKTVKDHKSNYCPNCGAKMEN